MLELLNRGLMTEDEVRQALRETRLKNKYIDLMLASRVAIPPEATIRRMYGLAVLTRDRAMTLMRAHGYEDDIAGALLDEALGTRHQKARDLTQGQIVALYKDLAIDRPTATGMLTSLGYSDEESGWLLALADIERVVRYTNQAIGFVHGAYRSRKIDENQAATTLDGLRIPPDQRNELLALWDLERSVSTKELTLAQLHAALKKGILSTGEFSQRLAGIGYSADDILILVELYSPSAP
jgi:hypothetical protein